MKRSKGLNSIFLMFAVAAMAFLTGCSVVGSAMGKWGAMEITLEGKSTTQGAIESFKKAVRANGGFVNAINADSATASFKEAQVNLDMTAEPAAKGVIRVVIRSSSGTTVSRLYEMKDNLGEIPMKVANDMQGFAIVSQKRL